MKVLALTGIEELERTFRHATPHEVHISFSEKYGYLMDDICAIEDTLVRDNFDALVINRYLDQSEDGKEIVELFRCIKKERPEFRMILILSEYDKRVVYPLVKAGIYDLIISSDIKCSSIIKLLEEPAEEFDFKAYEVSEEKESGINIQVPSFKRQEKWKSKKVITTYSPFSKGASELAVSITQALSKKSDKVCLVDFDYLRPTIREKLSIKSSEGLYDAIQLARQENLSAQTILNVLKENDGYMVLTGMYDPNEYNHINESYIEKIIEVLQSNFEFLVIDVHSYHDLTANYVAFEKSDFIYAVTTGDRHTLERTKVYVEMFNKYNDIEADTLKLVVNNYGGFDLTSVEIENMMEMEVYYLPNSPKGFLEKYYKKNYEKSINQLIKDL